MINWCSFCCQCHAIYSATDKSKITAPALFSDSVRLFSRATTTKKQNCFDKKKNKTVLWLSSQFKHRSCQNILNLTVLFETPNYEFMMLQCSFSYRVWNLCQRGLPAADNKNRSALRTWMCVAFFVLFWILRVEEI